MKASAREKGLQKAAASAAAQISWVTFATEFREAWTSGSIACRWITAFTRRLFGTCRAVWTRMISLSLVFAHLVDFSHCLSPPRWLQVRTPNAWTDGCADIIQNGQFSPHLFTGLKKHTLSFPHVRLNFATNI